MRKLVFLLPLLWLTALAVALAGKAIAAPGGALAAALAPGPIAVVDRIEDDLAVVAFPDGGAGRARRDALPDLVREGDVLVGGGRGAGGGRAAEGGGGAPRAAPAAGDDGAPLRLSGPDRTREGPW